MPKVKIIFKEEKKPIGINVTNYDIVLLNMGDGRWYKYVATNVVRLSQSECGPDQLMAQYIATTYNNSEKTSVKEEWFPVN